MKILLDNGHGIDTKGKRSPFFNLFEWEFNRDIVRRIHEQIKESVILVPEIEDISLQERCKRANRYDNAVLVSVHANAGGGTGSEIWTTRGKTRSDEYANQIVRYLKNLPFKCRGHKQGNLYILRHCKHPAVLIECLFMDNKRDCKYMMTEEGRKNIAKNIANSLLVLK